MCRSYTIANVSVPAIGDGARASLWDARLGHLDATKATQRVTRTEPSGQSVRVGSDARDGLIRVALGDELNDGAVAPSRQGEGTELDSEVP